MSIIAYHVFMPRPKAYVPQPGSPPVTITKSSKPDKTSQVYNQASTAASPTRKLIDNIPLDKRAKRTAIPDTTSLRTLSIDKHTENLRYRLVYVVDKLVDDLSRAASRPNKKDKEYIKGLVWSVGVLFDKLNTGAGQDALVIRIPARLLENVKTVIGIQAGKKAHPAPVLDRQSSGHVIDTTGYALPVADTVADHDASPNTRLDSSSPALVDNPAKDGAEQAKGETLAPGLGGAATDTR